MAKGLWVGILTAALSTLCVATPPRDFATLCRLALEAEATIPDAIQHYLSENSLHLEPFEHDRHNLWDNWGAWDGRYGIYHRYSQTAVSHLGLGSTDKSAHNEAAIRHFVSADGKIWYHLGLVLEKKAPDELAYWSGKLVIHNGLYYLFHTRGETSGRNQYIAVSVSRDGQRFSKSKAILKPSDRWNYTFDDTDGAIPAWRDPEVFWHDKVQCWVMIFATKTSRNGSTDPGFGLATSVDLFHWNLLPAVAATLPESLRVRGAQLELPNIEVRPGKFRLYASYSVPEDGDKPAQLGALYWDVNSLGAELDSPSILYDDSRYYGFSLLAGTALLFSTDQHDSPYRMASVPLLP